MQQQPSNDTDDSGTIGVSGPDPNPIPLSSNNNDTTIDHDHITSLLSEVVCLEDKQLIVDILHSIKMCRSPDTLCTSWTVTPSSTGYTLIAYLPRMQDHQVEVTHDDINMIECVNMLRVRVGVAQFPQGTWGLKIHIVSHTKPISFSMYDTMRINVRRAMVNPDGRSGWLGSILSGWVHGRSSSDNTSKRRKRVPGDT